MINEVQMHFFVINTVTNWPQIFVVFPSRKWRRTTENGGFYNCFLRGRAFNLLLAEQDRHIIEF